MTHATAGALSVLDDFAVERAKTGDLDALERVYRSYEGLVYAMGRRICRTEEDAEDVLQETFLEVCRSIRGFRGTGSGSLTAWVKRIAASKALMRVRREKYRDADELAEDGGAIGVRPMDVGLQLDLEAALARLPETSRAVVWLHDVEGYTHEDIAEMMGKTASFSKSQLARAHTRLRAWLGEE
jgi:RNA polymerase sigma-70 factor (ECF subfamily)